MLGKHSITEPHPQSYKLLKNYGVIGLYLERLMVCEKDEYIQEWVGTGDPVPSLAGKKTQQYNYV
jgi:hypothetical protein